MEYAPYSLHVDVRDCSTACMLDIEDVREQCGYLNIDVVVFISCYAVIVLSSYFQLCGVDRSPKFLSAFCPHGLSIRNATSPIRQRVRF